MYSIYILNSFLMFWNEPKAFCELYPISAVCNELLWCILEKEIMMLLSLTQADCTMQI